VPLDSQFDAMVNRACKHFFPSIKSELSLVNSLIELKDFKTVPRTLSKMKSLFSKNIAKKTLSKILNAGSDGYLQTQFNLLPLLSDISGIQNALDTARRKAEKLIDRELKIETRHFTADFGNATYKNRDETSTTYSPFETGSGRLALMGCTTPYTVSSDPSCYGCRTRRIVHYTKRKFHAQIVYSYVFTDLQKQYYKLFSLLDAFGVQLNPAIIWNAIPWTFVVDWVVGVSRFLDQYKLQNMEPVIVVHKFLASQSIERKITLDLESGISTTYKNIPRGTRTMVITESSYRRKVGFTSNQWSQGITASGLSFKEITLAGALSVPRILKRLKPRW